MATTMTRAQSKLKRTAAAAAGATSAGPTAAVRPPSAAKRRRPVFIALAVLLIVGSAAAATLLALHFDDRTQMLVAARAIAPGTQITRADLATKPVAADGVDLIPASRVNDVVGKYAASSIPAGRLLDARMLGAKGYLVDGKAAVGVVLANGRYPSSGLQPGDVVQVVSVASGNPTVLVDSATVSSVGSTNSGAGSLVGSADTSSAATATLVVNSADAPKVAAASAANQVAVILVSRGTAG